jgi:hypothetical protein
MRRVDLNSNRRSSRRVAFEIAVAHVLHESRASVNSGSRVLRILGARREVALTLLPQAWAAAATFNQEPGEYREPRLSPAPSGGRTVEPVTEEDF